MPLGIQRNKILHHRRPQNQAIYFRTINLKKNWVWLPVFCWIIHRSSPVTPQMSLLMGTQLHSPQWGAKVSCPQAWGSSSWEQLKAESPRLVPQHPLLVQVELPLLTELVILGPLLLRMLLMLKLQNFGHLMPRANSFAKTLMLRVI